MSDTAVAEARAPQPAEGDRKEGRWRSHWAARIGLPAAYLLATRTLSWVDATAEFCRRLSTDAPVLATRFAPDREH